jgi:hypothetical protein
MTLNSSNLPLTLLKVLNQRKSRQSQKNHRTAKKDTNSLKKIKTHKTSSKSLHTKNSKEKNINRLINSSTTKKEVVDQVTKRMTDTIKRGAIFLTRENTGTKTNKVATMQEIKDTIIGMKNFKDLPNIRIERITTLREAITSENTTITKTKSTILTETIRDSLVKGHMINEDLTKTINKTKIREVKGDNKIKIGEGKGGIKISTISPRITKETKRRPSLIHS